MRRRTLITIVAGVTAPVAYAAELPVCESNTKPEYAEFLPLTPPHTEYVPSGCVMAVFTIDSDGSVSDVSLSECNLTPKDRFLEDYVIRSVQQWRFPAREHACRRQQKIMFQVDEDA